MKAQVHTRQTATLLRQRLALLWTVAGLLMANVSLALGLVLKEERWVLIPQFDIHRRLALSTHSFSTEYLIEWATSLCEDLFTVSPHTVEIKKNRFLQVAAKPSGEILDSLTKMMAAIKQNHSSTVFYPKTFQVDRQAETVTVGGTFLTYFGRDRRPIAQDRRFVVGWTRGPHGVLLVRELVEEKETKE